MTSLNGTMVPIETVEVGAGGQAAIEFTNIPQTYTDLVVKVSGRSTATTTGVDITFNGSSTSYTNRRLYGTGSTAASDSAGTAYISNTMIADSSYTANTFGNGEFYIPNYTSSNNKSISVDGASENNATTALMMLTAGLWSNSAAITSVKITPNAGNFAQYSTATLYGVKNYALTQIDAGAKASGGIVTSDANYWYHTFTSSQTFTPIENLTADFLVVAGGGGGGRGPGGAGGLRGFTSQSLTNGTSYTVTVGAGGNKAASDPSTGSNGNNSSISGSGFSTITSSGGGGGGSGASNANGNGLSGGSGGGAGNDDDTGFSGGAGNVGGYSPVEGYAGGACVIYAAFSQYGSGGGGGAASAGQSNISGGAGGNYSGLPGQGSSAYSTWGEVTGTGHNVNNTYYYSGGGTSRDTSYRSNGGGGAAGDANGLTSTGGGAGGGGNGGSGIVIIRYPK